MEMERLTGRNESGEAYYKKCFEEPCSGLGKSDCARCEYHNLTVCERLATFEDLGISPEQMKEIDRMYRELCEQLDKLQAENQVQDDEMHWLSWLTLEEWGEIQCPMLDNKPVMTYYAKGEPCYYSYTAPFVSDGEVFCYRYDHDEGCWDEDTMFCLGDYEDFIKGYNGGAE